MESVEHIGKLFDGSPVTKRELVAAAEFRGAPAPVVRELERLPDGSFRDLRSLWPELPSLPVEV